MTDSCWGVVVAAGGGARFGGGRPKALLELAGTALVVHAVRALREGGCSGVVVAVRADLMAAVAELLPESDVRVVAGGSTRQESVSAGLRAVPANARWVLIHDAARPLVPPAVVSAVRATLADGAPAVIPVLPVADTIKSVDPAGMITATVDRSTLARAQTPQGFERDLLERALENCVREQREVTDDAAAVAALGVPVRTVPGDARGLKITTPADLAVARAMLEAEPPMPSMDDR